MLNMAWIVLGCLIFGVAVDLGASQFDPVPIGAIFNSDDSEATHMRSAVNDEITRSRSRTKLELDSHTIATDDSYTLTTAMCSSLANGVIALFGVHTARTQNTIKTFTDELQMPFLSLSTAVNLTDQNNGYMLYMRPMYSKAILDVIRHNEWNEVHYFYHNDDGLLRLHQLFDEIVSENIQLQVKIFKVDNATHASKTLSALDSDSGWHETNVLLDMPSYMCQELLVNQKTDTMRTSFHYFIIGLGIMGEMNGTDYRYGGVNIIGFEFVDSGGERVEKVETALSVDAVKLIARTLDVLSSSYPEVFIRPMNEYNNATEGIDCDADPTVPWVHGPHIMKTLKETYINGQTGRISFDDRGMRVGYTLALMEVSLHRGMAKVGSWTLEKRLSMHYPSLVRHHGYEPMNKTYIVTSILSEPYLMLRPTSPGGKPLLGNDRFEGYCADMARLVGRLLRINYVIVPVKDGRYGAQNVNGSWDGMIGELIREEADMAIAPLTITSRRERVVDFTKPFMSTGISIMVKRPKYHRPPIFSFMAPFSFEIWISIAFAYVAVSVVLYLVSRFVSSKCCVKDGAEGPAITNNCTILDSMWFTLGSLMWQGNVFEPRTLSGRFVTSVWWFVAVILISNYLATLINFSGPGTHHIHPIRSAGDLARQTVVKYGTVEGGSTMQFFRQSTIPNYQRMWVFMASTEPHVFVRTVEEGVERVRGGQYAFLMESTTNEYISQRMPCDTMKVGENLNSEGYGIASPLGSVLRDRLTLAVLQLRESGELQRLEKKWWFDKGQCGIPYQGRVKGDNSFIRPCLDGLFYIVAVGLVLALIVVLLEFLFNSFVEARRMKASFSSVAMSYLRLFIKGEAPDNTGGVKLPSDAKPDAPAGQAIGLDEKVDDNTNNQ